MNEEDRLSINEEAETQRRLVTTLVDSFIDQPGPWSVDNPNKAQVYDLAYHGQTKLRVDEHRGRVWIMNPQEIHLPEALEKELFVAYCIWNIERQITALEKQQSSYFTGMELRAIEGYALACVTIFILSLIMYSALGGG